jgi:hypothetical protein
MLLTQYFTLIYKALNTAYYFVHLEQLDIMRSKNLAQFVVK